MDAVFSLPLLSVLLLPTFTGYGTTLNIFFFYLTWSTLILSHDALKIELAATLAVRLLFYLLPAYVFFFFDSAIPSLAALLKEHGENALPLRMSVGSKRRRRTPTWWKVMLLSTINVVLGALLPAAIDLILTRFLHRSRLLQVSTTLPLPWAVIKDLVRGLLLREMLVFGVHRYILHGMSSPLQTWHGAYYHALPLPYSLTAHYDHPVTYFLRTVLPDYLPAAIFRMHLLTFIGYLALVSLEELFASSGYKVLPTGFVMGGIARRQERHLLGGGQGNFGAYGLLDLLAGTNVGTDVLDDIRDEAERKDVPRRVKNKAKQAEDKVRRRRRDS